MRLLRHVWILPFLVLFYVYGNEALGVFQGSSEHFELLSGLGFSGGVTTALVWLGVLIETVIIAVVIVRPSALTFSIAALWPWVPRIIATATGASIGGGHDMGMGEMYLSLAATIGAMCSYMAYEHGFYPKFLRGRHSIATS